MTAPMNMQSFFMGLPIKKQKGASLILFAVLLLLVASAAFFAYFDSSQYKIERERKTFEALAEAKAALIGWSAAHPQYPGILPFPDRSANDSNYDGNSDCVNSGLAYSHLLGKLPYIAQTAPCVGTGASQYGLAANLMDGYGERLWYAVSKNLIRTGSASVVINPSIADAPTYPWMVVRNKTGQIISNRVAAVILAPGPVTGTQNRAGGLAGPSAYLDSLSVGGVTYSNANYSVPNEDFILGEDLRYVPSNHPDYGQPYYFNDKLVYITIDELMMLLETRAVREAALVLRAYYTDSSISAAGRFYPYAATLGDENNVCVEGQLMGALPIANTLSTCTHPDPGLSSLPAWFIESDWHDYMYYAVSSDCSFATPGCALGAITVGTQTNVHAVLLSAGSVLSGQVRPSSNPADYLDSVENANSDFVFDAVGTPRTALYNDQMLVVAP